MTFQHIYLYAPLSTCIHFIGVHHQSACHPKPPRLGGARASNAMQQCHARYGARGKLQNFVRYFGKSPEGHGFCKRPTASPPGARFSVIDDCRTNCANEKIVVAMGVDGGGRWLLPSVASSFAVAFGYRWEQSNYKFPRVCCHMIKKKTVFPGNDCILLLGQETKRLGHKD